jgi:hypothetical protein
MVLLSDLDIMSFNEFELVVRRRHCLLNQNILWGRIRDILLVEIIGKKLLIIRLIISLLIKSDVNNCFVTLLASIRSRRLLWNIIHKSQISRDFSRAKIVKGLNLKYILSILLADKLLCWCFIIKISVRWLR